MNKKKIVLPLLFIVVLTAAGYIGLKLYLGSINASLVFYRSGEPLAIGTEEEPPGAYPDLPDQQVRNIILYIGDGMGLGHLSAARMHWLGAGGRLHIERMPVTGLVTTHSIDDLITDSAAAATALATGVKTTNGSIGIDAEGRRLYTIMEAARDAGMATGLVTSTQLTDATPAAFVCHVASRGDKYEIAEQLIRSRTNVLLGEGEYLFPKSDRRSVRTDDSDLLAVAGELGYEVIDNSHDLDAATSDYLLGVFENVTPDRWAEVRERPAATPSLAEMTEKAIEILSRNEAGFFLMVEEEGMDLGGHANRLDYLVRHVKHFDNAVKTGIDFALRDHHTLVIVTADHETGGLNIVGGSRAGGNFQVTWSTDRHTAQPVPLFAFGPYATNLAGLQDNTAVPRVIADLLRLKIGYHEPGSE